MKESPADIIIRPIRQDDAPALAALEAKSIGAARWGEAAYREIESNGVTGWAAERNAGISGFILVRAIADEMEILNLAVDPAARRQRIGRTLLQRAIQDAGRRNVSQMHLEVRESNSTARAFYLSAGFAEHSRRKNYYSKPVEDAVLMTLRLR